VSATFLLCFRVQYRVLLGCTLGRQFGSVIPEPFLWLSNASKYFQGHALILNPCTGVPFNQLIWLDNRINFHIPSWHFHKRGPCCCHLWPVFNVWEVIVTGTGTVGKLRRSCRVCMGDSQEKQGFMPLRV
jgi:hypothetical protein